MDISTFRGVWRRLRIEEPIGTLAPDNEQNLCVLWIQSACGLFIDLRVPSGPSSNDVRQIKSFAGRATFDDETKRLTWIRHIDFRFPGTPDIGIIDFLEDNLIQEDGVDGDNYREIWRRDAVSSTEECAAILTSSERENGYFIISNGFFALSIMRDNVIDINQMKEFFNGGTIDLSEQLLTYVTVVGKVDTWKIDYSLNAQFVNMSLQDCIASVKDNFAGRTWNVVLGNLPDFIAATS